MESEGAFYAAGSSADMTRSEEDSLVDGGPLISDDVLHAATRTEFHTVPTGCYAVLLSLLHVVYIISSLCVVVLCVLKRGQNELCTHILDPKWGDSAVVLGKAVLWVLVQAFTGSANYYHRQTRNRGYLQFYRSNKRLKGLPFIVYSTGNVVVLIITAVRLPVAVYTYVLIGVLALELLVALPCLIYYAVKMRSFNTERAVPDVLREENLPSFRVCLHTETGFRERSSLEEVVEKQADLIEYLQHHNSLLSRKILNLTAQQQLSN
ncbi:transmembrane protein 192 isoform X2 [Hippocampus zosterae]|uniref:transmembrane protein 192 isoform X2 n=1 Tax=Hippocampus zosterae TaxID=109293 RepID=UPI00223E8732|nr:transmembrane protein 192 isoform X2 [Hippocampus zosterae]